MESATPTNVFRRPAIGRVFGAWLTGSLVFHAALVIGYGIYEHQKDTVLEMPEEPIKAVLVKLGKPRDEKLLPRINTAPKPAPAEKAVAVPTKDAPKEKAPDVKEEPTDEKKMSAVDRIREQVERDEARKNALDKIADRVGKVQEDEEGQADGDPRGDDPTPSQIQGYLATVGGRVKRLFVVPSVLEASECARLKAAIAVRLSANGDLVDVSVQKSSGSQLFDSAVVSTVKAAAPFPPPPPNMRELVMKGFGFNFRCAN